MDYKIFNESTIKTYVAIKSTNLGPEDERCPEIIVLFREPLSPGRSCEGKQS